MSFFTTYDFFTNAATGGIEPAQWVNVGNCLTDVGYAQIDFGNNFNNDLLHLDTCPSAQEIPGGTPWAAGVTILAIRVQILLRPIWGATTGGTISMQDINLAGAPFPLVTFNEAQHDGIDQLVTVGDTLANMGMTQLDAQNFADGLAGEEFRFEVVNPFGGGTSQVRVYTAKAQFEYDYSGGGGSPVGVQVPRLF